MLSTIGLGCPQTDWKRQRRWRERGKRRETSKRGRQRGKMREMTETQNGKGSKAKEREGF